MTFNTRAGLPQQDLGVGTVGCKNGIGKWTTGLGYRKTDQSRPRGEGNWGEDTNSAFAHQPLSASKALGENPREDPMDISTSIELFFHSRRRSYYYSELLLIYFVALGLQIFYVESHHE